MKLIDIIEAVEKKPLTPEQLAWWKKHIQISIDFQTVNGKAAYNKSIESGKKADFGAQLKSTSDVRLVFSFLRSPITECPIPADLIAWYLPKLESVAYEDATFEADSKLVNMSVKSISLSGSPKVNSLKPLLALDSVEELTFSTAIYYPDAWKTGVLTLLKMPHLKKIKLLGQPSSDSSKALRAALDIVQKHLTEKDISECMDELMEAGLKEYARL
jgi:hypothetical protein